MPALSKVTLPIKIKNRLKKIVQRHNIRTGENLSEEGYATKIVKEVIIANELEDYKQEWKKTKEAAFKTDVANKKAQIENAL